jgi:YbgC/YbaW family acyl-CoA thioester hydrolase
MSPSPPIAHDEELPDPASVVIRRRIEWIDTDAAGIYHWTTVFRLAEAAEAAMLTALGIEGTFGSAPRVAVSVDFKRSLRFNDPVELELAVESVGRSSLVYRLTLTSDAGVAADGTLTVCFIDQATRKPAPWPQDVRERLSGGGRVEAAA